MPLTKKGKKIKRKMAKLSKALADSPIIGKLSILTKVMFQGMAVWAKQFKVLPRIITRISVNVVQLQKHLDVETAPFATTNGFNKPQLCALVVGKRSAVSFFLAQVLSMATCAAPSLWRVARPMRLWNKPPPTKETLPSAQRTLTRLSTFPRTVSTVKIRANMRECLVTSSTFFDHSRQVHALGQRRLLPCH